MKDFYYILGLDVNCTANEIKDAYRKLSKKFHPDLNQNDKYFENRFKDIQEAYETLGDTYKRVQYSQQLKNLKSSSVDEDIKKQQFYNNQDEILRQKEEELKRREDNLKHQQNASRQQSKSNSQYKQATQTNSQYQTESAPKNKSTNTGVGAFILIFSVVAAVMIVLIQSNKKNPINNKNADTIKATSIVTSKKINHHKKHNIQVYKKDTVKAEDSLIAEQVESSDNKQVSDGDNKQLSDDEDKIFSQVEKQPDFPGGIEKFYDYLKKNITFPTIDRESNIMGKVICQFVIEKDGSLSDIKAIRGPSQSEMDEAIRVLRTSPKWHPGIRNNRPVRVIYTVPINFILSNND